MRAQMIRVISSPSISTTGFFTLIFAIADEPLMRGCVWEASEMPAPYGADRSILQAPRRGSRLEAFKQSMAYPAKAGTGFAKKDMPRQNRASIGLPGKMTVRAEQSFEENLATNTSRI